MKIIKHFITIVKSVFIVMIICKPEYCLSSFKNDTKLTLLSSTPWIIGQGIKFIPEFHKKRFNSELQIPAYYFSVWGLNHIPVYNHRLSDGLLYSSLQALLIGGYFLNFYNGSNEKLDEFFINSYRTVGLTSTYHIYRTSKIALTKNVEQAGPNLISTREMFLSPFRWKNISHPLFYIPACLMIGGFAVIGGTMASDPIWKHDTVYVGDKRMSKSLALLSMSALSIGKQTINSVGEEAFFRGVWYDIWKEKYGIIVAKLVDNMFFVGKHVPEMIKDNEKAGVILGRCSYLLLMSNIFEFACDIDQFPIAITLHMWTNTFMNDLLPFIYNGGKNRKV